MGTELEERNAKATRLALEGGEERILDMERELSTLRSMVQTLRDEVQQLKQTNTLALQRLRGSGATGPA